jgi:succinate dehydrogenase hydrophobic anchor subunit
MPALPLDTAGKYVAAVYLVFLVLILIYVAIMSSRLGRVERDIAELDSMLQIKEDHEKAASSTE